MQAALAVYLGARARGAGKPLTAGTIGAPRRAAMNEFLNPVRMRAWCMILAGWMAIWALLAITQAALGTGSLGKDLGIDFTCYRAAGELAARGMAAAAYQPGLMAAAQNAQRALPAGQYFPFYYPPPYLLLCLPLTLLPYWPAMVAFLAAGFAPLVLALRRLEPPGFGWLPILAFPGMLVTAGTGQNGFLSAACFAGFMLLADKRPWLAGACLGLLACKPHLAVLVPFVLLAGGRWRSLAAAALTFAALAAISAAAFGLAPWWAFLHASRHAIGQITGAMVDESKIQSAFIAVRMLGGGIALAGIVQAVVGAVALAATLLFVRRRPGGPAEGAALATAALLCTPYLADYDLACLAPPLAFAACRAVGAGWRRYEKLTLLAVFLLPIFARGVADRTGLQLAPLFMAALLAVIVRPPAPRFDPHAATAMP